MVKTRLRDIVSSNGSISMIFEKPYFLASSVLYTACYPSAPFISYSSLCLDVLYRLPTVPAPRQYWDNRRWQRQPSTTSVYTGGTEGDSANPSTRISIESHHFQSISKQKTMKWQVLEWSRFSASTEYPRTPHPPNKHRDCLWPAALCTAFQEPLRVLFLYLNTIHSVDMRETYLKGRAICSVCIQQAASYLSDWRMTLTQFDSSLLHAHRMLPWPDLHKHLLEFW